jgi:hypothetical protein
MACRIALAQGGYLLQTDATSYVILADASCAAFRRGGGGGAGLSAWYYKKLADRRRRLRDEEYQRRLAIRYAEQLAAALERANAEDAARLAESAQRLEALLAGSETQQAYLIQSAERLVVAARLAAQLAAQEAENRRIEAAMREAAVLAARIEEELRDEEEALFLLMMV